MHMKYNLCRNNNPYSVQNDMPQAERLTAVLDAICTTSTRSRCLTLTFTLAPYSADDTEIIVPISADISEAALVSFAVTGSALLTTVGLGFSCPSGSTCWASFTFLFFNDRSFPIGPGLCSLFSTGLKSGS